MSKDRMLFEHTLRILQDNVLWSNQGERDNLISRIKSFLKEPIDDRKILGGVEIGSGWFNGEGNTCVVTHFEEDRYIWAIVYVGNDLTTESCCSIDNWFKYFQVIPGFKYEQ